MSVCGIFLKDLLAHMKQTKMDKYEKGKIPTIDFIKSKFGLTDFALSNVIKYATRYKETKNKKDLLKAAHYLGMVYEEDL